MNIWKSSSFCLVMKLTEARIAHVEYSIFTNGNMIYFVTADKDIKWLGMFKLQGEFTCSFGQNTNSLVRDYMRRTYIIYQQINKNIELSEWLPVWNNVEIIYFRL